MTSAQRVAPGVTDRMLTWAGDVAGLRPPVAVERIGGGRSNLTFLLTGDGGRRAVLRRPPLGELLPSAHDMRREHRILHALASTDVPVPQVLGLSEDDTLCEHPFYVMAHVDGLVVDSAAAAGLLDPAARRTAGEQLAQALARLHRVDVDAVGLGDLGRRTGYAERQLRRWQAQWERTRDGRPSSLDRTAERLHAAGPGEPPRPTLVHGDFNLANVVVDDDGRVLAVLDWELCTIGHPLADLGTLLTYWPEEVTQSTLERDPVPLLPGFPDRAGIVAAYAAVNGELDLQDLDLWVALASWKLAIIMQGVHRRWLEDPANGGRDAGSVEAAVGRLADLAEAALDRHDARR
ncbi:MAG TPA: phosphotransferase family protein [Baekduia sp.]|nr:phosphotransferase family protein [Baekduia sp.]